MTRAGTLIAGIDGVVEVRRSATAVIAHLLRPSRVASTGERGGLRTDVTAVYNHQCCEPAGHWERLGDWLSQRTDEAHDLLCQTHALDPATTTGMSTAASVRCLAVAQRTHRDLTVLAAVTAGIDGNAARAGDPASFHEWDGAFHAVDGPDQPAVGTINIMIFYSHELRSDALLGSIMTATEAKTTVLADLGVGSLYSQGLATGTGTDQLIAACPIGDVVPLTIAGKHSMVGQLTAEAVREALREALEMQAGATPHARRAVSVQLRRFGFTREGLYAEARRMLSPADADLLEANILGVDKDPVTVAAAVGFAAALDQIAAGIIPAGARGEIHERYARMLAAAASVGAAEDDDFVGLATPDPVTTAYRAMAVGFARKWQKLHEAIDTM